MGLGKTIQTIALLAHWAATKGQWGPHLIVVPTSVMLNWEMEFKKWCPAFKVLTYYGNARQRQAKRQGWSKPNSFHVCITSYTLILSDAKMFRRKQWNFMVLDEAHMIKNWQSQRWQTLLNFHSRHRVLLTGTPLQNNLMELWSLMHFLMPHVFESHDDFKEWFSNPLTGMVEGQGAVNRHVIRRLHGILRPFIMRRLKSQVEKQMPKKFEHIVKCRLSRRQRTLYEDYMSSSETRTTLASGNYFGVFGVLMSLRKVCNHPDLFEGRPIVSPFVPHRICFEVPSLVTAAIQIGPSPGSLDLLNLNLSAHEGMTAAESQQIARLATPADSMLDAARNIGQVGLEGERVSQLGSLLRGLSNIESPFLTRLRGTFDVQLKWCIGRAKVASYVNDLRCCRRPVYGRDLRMAVQVEGAVSHIHRIARDAKRWLEFSCALRSLILTYEGRLAAYTDFLQSFLFAISRVKARPVALWCPHPEPSAQNALLCAKATVNSSLAGYNRAFHVENIRHHMYFPDKRLVQYDCGKLQELASLLRGLQKGGHRVLIFTQMSKMLDVLEAFLNLYQYTYMRLDGSTKPDERQVMMTKFNSDPRIFCFILSTRSGGVGINLTGADTVVFYDSDWNPAMDAQAQDRCHRIGQTREVHIYRLVTEHTIEENIVLKSNQKRHLDHLAIQSGGFGALASGGGSAPVDGALQALGGGGGGGLSAKDIRRALQSAEDADDRTAAARAEREAEAERAEFSDEEEGEPGTEGGGQQGELGVKTERPKEVDFEARGEGQVPPISQLEGLLYPVERYAVAFFEELYPATKEELGQAKSEKLKREAWDLEDLEESRAMIEEGYNPEDLVIAEPFDVAATKDYYSSCVQLAANVAIVA
mmetsp:Transcript_20269/g.57059  ORF Transcript_20269/g.57059 Transcript_20269/m.57059 type:complete len:871 (-) Transcript_20269:75-2687(-)